MANIVVMPKMGFNMEQGTLVRWNYSVGDTVKRGEVIAEVETDKTVVNYDSEFSGVLLKILVEEGETVPVVTPIAIVGEAGEDISQLISESSGQKTPSAPEETAPAAPQQPVVKSVSDKVTTGKKYTMRAQKYIAENGLDIEALDIVGTGFEGGITERDIKAYLKENEVKISPLAKKMAADASVNINELTGSGIGGKIMSADIPTVAAYAPGGTEILKKEPYVGMRKVIGDRLSQSKFTAPHLYFTVSADMGALLDLRKQVNENAEEKISVNDFILAAAIIALQNNPAVNASLMGGEIVYYKDVNIGMAVALDQGLIVPVLRKAQCMKLSSIAQTTKQLAAKAKAGGLLPDDYSGGTFTVSNLGMFGIENFTAIINPPESAILSVSATKWTPVAAENAKDSAIVIKPMMNMTLSVDHRVIDGMVATKFIVELKELLENPFKILL